MEISKKDIKCREIVDKIERLTSSIRKFIQLVNKSLPKGSRLVKEHFIIEKVDDRWNFLDDGKTQCIGFKYTVFWAYTLNVSTSKEQISYLQQPNTVTFVLQCGERCYDHKPNRSYIFSLYYKSRNFYDKAKALNSINENYNENNLFNPYLIMEVVWKVRDALGLNTSYIPEDIEVFEKFSESFQNLENRLHFCKTYLQAEKVLSKEAVEKIYEFQDKANQFATIVNCYCAVASGKVTIEDLKKFITPIDDIITGEITPNLITAIEEFLSNSFDITSSNRFIPESFLIQKDSHSTFNYNERKNSFRLFDCIKSIVGYSYFNKNICIPIGIYENWYPRMLYFSYYASQDLQECYYTISLTNCETKFGNSNIKIIEESTLEQLLSSKNAIEIAKWLEEIWKKTELIYYYNSLIKKNNIRNFEATCEIH